ncbi:hypothetical protein AVEN_76537-1 [Araneus ventricosus]|uniref:Uncharacterized protein n=1 Tax=Araneus ventricosus TaxID=182803 RepID=A0A4Y2CDL0_ARAVE|nr:hypothetical protein AVEN_76537-1 [Araneus ventricosus]
MLNISSISKKHSNKTFSRPLAENLTACEHRTLKPTHLACELMIHFQLPVVNEPCHYCRYLMNDVTSPMTNATTRLLMQSHRRRPCFFSVEARHRPKSFREFNSDARRKRSHFETQFRHRKFG